MMKKNLCKKCNRYSKLKDIDIHKDPHDVSIFGSVEKCWCPNCGAEMPLDPESAQVANPLSWLVALLCLIAVLIIGVLPEPYSTLFALTLSSIIGVILYLQDREDQRIRKLIGIILFGGSVYLFFSLPMNF